MEATFYETAFKNVHQVKRLTLKEENSGLHLHCRGRGVDFTRKLHN